MSSFTPPSYNSDKFNSDLFTKLTDGLTLANADQRYIRINGSGYLSTLTVSGNTNIGGTLSIGGSVVNLSLLTGAVAGVSTANKVLSLNASSYLDKLTLDPAGVGLDTPLLTTNSINFSSGTKRIQDVSVIDFNPTSTSKKTIIRKSTATDTGIEFYDLQDSSATHAMLSFKCGNAVDDYTALKLYQPYNADDTAATSWGQSCQIQLREVGKFASGLTLATTATASYGEGDRINLSVNGGATPYLTVNPQKSTIHIRPQNYAELNSTWSENVVIGEAARCRKTLLVDGVLKTSSYLQVGSSTDTSRLISALNGSMTAGQSVFLTLGRDNSAKNQAEISYYYAGSNNTDSRLDFGFFGGALMFLKADGKLGLGTSSPSTGLDVNTGEYTVAVAPTFSQDARSYSIGSNSWTNFGAGPVSAGMCARFRGSVWIQDRLWAQSDRRLKEDINDLNISTDHYKKLNPVSYRWKNQKQVCVGLIAQEVNQICGEAIHYVPNENMTKESDDDIDGVQLNVDYNAIHVMSISVIKQLITRIEQLESLVEKLISRPVVAKWLQKTS